MISSLKHECGMALVLLSTCIIVLYLASGVQGACTYVPNVANGIVKFPRPLPYPNNTVVVYECQPGYELDDPKSNCMLCWNTSWWGPVPVCRPEQCQDPVPLNNGEVRSHGPYIHGSRAVFGCKIGYELRGPNDTWVCRSGSWSGTMPFCTQKECPAPQPISNGELKSIPPYINSSRAWYQCLTNFAMRGPAADQQCWNGRWFGRTPACVPEFCSEPGFISNGFVASEGPYYHMSRATFSCRTGYVMNGHAFTTCINGTWVPRAAPSCSIQHRTIVEMSFFPLWLVVTLTCILLLLVIFILLYLCCVCCCCRRCCSHGRVRHFDPTSENYIEYHNGYDTRGTYVYGPVLQSNEVHHVYGELEDSGKHHINNKQSGLKKKHIATQTADLKTRTVGVQSLDVMESDMKLTNVAAVKETESRSLTSRQPFPQPTQYNQGSPNLRQANDEVKWMKQRQNDREENHEIPAIIRLRSLLPSTDFTESHLAGLPKSVSLPSSPHPTRTFATKREPVVRPDWMPHSNPVRNIKTSTK